MQFYYFPYLLSPRINESYASGSKSKCWSLDSLLRNDLTIVDLLFCYCSCKLQLSWCSMLIAIASQTSDFTQDIWKSNTKMQHYQSHIPVKILLYFLKLLAGYSGAPKRQPLWTTRKDSSHPINNVKALNRTCSNGSIEENHQRLSFLDELTLDQEHPARPALWYPQ